MANQGEIKRSAASLVGGIFVAIFAFVLWLLIAGGTEPAEVIIGLVGASLLGLWVRLADL
jgi:hypothetical protein